MEENPHIYRSLFNAVSTDTLARIYLDLLDQQREFPQDAITPCNIDHLLRHVRHLGQDVMESFEQTVGRYMIAAEDNLWTVE